MTTSGSEASRLEKRLVVSSSPHIRDRDTIPRIMWTVVATLIPPGIFAIFNFGFPALKIIVVSVATCIVVEYLVERLAGKPITISDGSAVVTGLLVAYVISPAVPIYVPIVASFVAIALAKHAFGGLGNNIWNPALAGRAFALAAFSGPMTAQWMSSKLSHATCAVDALTGATPLNAIKNGLRMAATGQLNNLLGENASASLSKIHEAVSTNLSNLIFGTTGGSIGETCAILLILGGCYLIWKGYIRWQMPVTFIATVALLGWALPVRVGYLQDGNVHTALVWFSGNPLFHIFSGGLILGAFYMATDMVTTPLTVKGTVIFGVGAGILTTVIRLYGGYPEGVCYAILLMNTVTPLIDRWTMPRVYGQQS